MNEIIDPGTNEEIYEYIDIIIDNFIVIHYAINKNYRQIYLYKTLNRLEHQYASR